MEKIGNGICSCMEHLKEGSGAQELMCQCIPDRIGIWQCWLLRRGENPEKNLSEQGENQQQTQPT